MEPAQWQLQPIAQLPDWLIEAVQQYLPGSAQFAAQLLWHRGIRSFDQLASFIDPNQYQPTSPFAFGEEMERAVARLQQALQTAEKVAIWGDFDADGITATAVLWEGLGAFFAPAALTYLIPNRLSESHGLSNTGLELLAAQGYSLIVTCDTGSTNLAEIEYAQRLGLDLIMTDHHKLSSVRPPVTAMLNPRTLPTDHPLANLAGVAVAYKLVEALYKTLPDLPQRPLSDLLDLVAIGLIADLVSLTGDCRYLAQIGIARLQQNQDPINPPRPGIAKLLEFCRRNGDRPTDISFGLGPRINAISRIHGDARFCVELLTSQDQARCEQLALQTELANARRKVLQRQVMQQAQEKLAQIDLSTTRVIVLADPQWSVGILGLVAGQIAQEYGRPTFLLSTEGSEAETQETPLPQTPVLARGSARSVNQIDLYELLQQQAHLLHRFGGHPFAAGLSLPVENISRFRQAVNQQLQLEQLPKPQLFADLQVKAADLGKSLFQELKLLEPYGIGNPVPKLLIRDCWFTKVWHKKIRDLSGRKLEYIKTEFELCDESCPQGFPGVWWGHYKDELPLGQCDVIVELDFNSYEDAKRQKRYEVRLLAVRAAVDQVASAEQTNWILDGRGQSPLIDAPQDSLLVTDCPNSWDELYRWWHQAKQAQRKLVLAYNVPSLKAPNELWQQLVGIAKYLSRTEKTVSLQQLQDKLKISELALQFGLAALKQMGFTITAKRKLQIRWQPERSLEQSNNAELAAAIEQFSRAVREEQFMQQYFYQVPLATLQATVAQRASN